MEIDRKTITLIASLVNERITVRERHSLPPRVYTCFQCSVAALGGVRSPSSNENTVQLVKILLDLSRSTLRCVCT